jgi:hypothetical protein
MEALRRDMPTPNEVFFKDNNNKDTVALIV